MRQFQEYDRGKWVRRVGLPEPGSVAMYHLDSGN